MILVPLLLLSITDPAATFLADGMAPASVGASLWGGAPELSSAVEHDVTLAQLTIEQRVIIRVPMARRDLAPPPPPAGRPRPDGPPVPLKWEEHKGPKCIQLSQLRGASITSSHGVDLMFRDATRMRARLGRECRPEDLYSGFYIQPNGDGTLCAGRDRLLARSGASCAITELKRLVPDK